ncbi:hypothetical protein [Paraburkholderia tropica]|uniref:hypothetical protein n=1 Tax=Paraburkholderia tropica TaxID=92647 RepID=UPI002AB684B1|nr:hypothetical protein [Paraburkholderia tropica]
MDTKKPTDAEIRATMTSEQIQLERKLTCEAINGAMAFGYQNTNVPPSDDHWLAPFWKIGRQQAELETRAALPSDAAGAPYGYVLRKDFEKGLSTTVGKKVREDDVPLYAAPVAPAAVAPSAEGAAMTQEQLAAWHRDQQRSFLASAELQSKAPGRPFFDEQAFRKGAAFHAAAASMLEVSSHAAPTPTVAADAAAPDIEGAMKAALGDKYCPVSSSSGLSFLSPTSADYADLKAEGQLPTKLAQPDERAACDRYKVLDEAGDALLEAGHSEAYEVIYRMMKDARAAAPRASLSDARILGEFEKRYMSVALRDDFGTPTLDGVRVLEGVRALLATAPTERISNAARDGDSNV